MGCDWLLDHVRANDKVIAVTAWVTELPSETEKVSENVPSSLDEVLGVIVNTLAFAPVPCDTVAVDPKEPDDTV